MNKQELLGRMTRGEEFKFQGFISGVFSNWHPAEIKADGHVFKNSEQYFMYKKAEFFEDKLSMEKILNAFDPQKAKELGRKVRNFDEDRWKVAAPTHMFVANLLKYSQNPHMAKTLFKTGDDILVECNPADLIWGAGIDIRDKRVSEPFEWPGENQLGFILMDVRDDLKETMGGK